jgi:hypothetical protein
VKAQSFSPFLYPKDMIKGWLRVAGKKGIEHRPEWIEHIEEVGKRQSPWSQVTSLLKKQSFK